MKAVSIVAVTGWIYYRSALAIFVLWPLGIVLYRQLEEELIFKKKGKFLLEFKEATELMSSALNVGYSVENSVREALKELQIFQLEKSLMKEELEQMVRQIRLQIPVEQVWMDFAKKTELEDIMNFASVFSVAKRSGGNMVEIIQNTIHQIGDKIDVRREIDTILAAKRYEFRVMCVIPYAMIAYMQVSFPEFMSVLYGNVLGIGVMTVCLSIYAAAYLLGAKIIKIEV